MPRNSVHVFVLRRGPTDIGLGTWPRGLVGAHGQQPPPRRLSSHPFQGSRQRINYRLCLCVLQLLDRAGTSKGIRERDICCCRCCQRVPPSLSPTRPPPPPRVACFFFFLSFFLFKHVRGSAPMRGKQRPPKNQKLGARDFHPGQRVGRHHQPSRTPATNGDVTGGGVGVAERHQSARERRGGFGLSWSSRIRRKTARRFAFGGGRARRRSPGQLLHNFATHFFSYGYHAGKGCPRIQLSRRTTIEPRD